MIKAPDGRAAVLRALEESGLSMAEFCRRRGLAYATVAAWRSMARRRAGGFVEVEAQGSSGPLRERSTDAAALCVELALPGGAVLRVYQRAGEGGAR
jgi:transposase-like protein